jgi:hypothetical protein
MRRVTTPAHTRRAFLGAAATLVAGAATGSTSMASAAPAGTPSSSSSMLTDLDVFETRLTRYARLVRRFTTPWGETVDDWYPAFQAAAADLAAHGGGRLVVPGGRKYPISASVAFDLPAVVVELQRGSYVEKVGTPDVFLGAPLGFYGNAKPGEPIENRIQREFAALIGPGAVGYPGKYVDLFPHENGCGFSYIKTVLVDGIRVPYAPGKPLTAQFGCNNVTFRNTICGPSGQNDAERTWPGQSAIVIQGTWAPSRRPPEWPLFGEIVVENNRIGPSVRGVYIEFVRHLRLAGNRFGETWGGGIQLAVLERASLVDNVLTEISTGVQRSGYEYHAVRRPTLISNVLRGHAHKHAVLSGQLPQYGIPAGVIRARHNDLALGTDTLFAGEPVWDVR